MKYKDNLNKVKDVVEEILINEPNTRDSDDLLIIKVYEHINPNVISKPFWYAISKRDVYNLPSFESIMRTRQRIQADNPKLRGTTRVKVMRQLREAEVKEWALRQAP